MSISGGAPTISNDTGENIIILNDNRRINCKVLIPKAAGDECRAKEIKYVVGDEEKSVPVTKVKGILYASGVKMKNLKDQPEGWYATVSMPNFDRISGIAYSMDGGVLKLVTSRLGVVEIKRRYITRISFAKKLACDVGYLYVCDPSGARVLKLDEEMRIVWSFKMKKGRPYFVRPLDNGNILIADRGSGRIIEVSPEKTIVWEKSIGNSFAACRLPNGNTLVSQGRGLVEIDPAGKAVKTHLSNFLVRYFDVTANGEFLIADMRSRSVLLLAGNGRQIFAHQMTMPGYVRVLPNGRFAALDQRSSSIVILGPKGKVVSSIPLPYRHVQSFGVSESGNIILAKWNGKNNTIYEYDASGKLVSQKTAEGIKFAIQYMDFR